MDSGIRLCGSMHDPKEDMRLEQYLSAICVHSVGQWLRYREFTNIV